MFIEARSSASRGHTLVRNRQRSQKVGLDRGVGSKEMIQLWSTVALQDRERIVDSLVLLGRTG